MRHFVAFIVITAFILASLSAELIAQGRGGGHVQGPKTTATHAPKTTATSGGKTTAPRVQKTTPAQVPKSNTVRGPKTTTRAPKATTTKSVAKGPKSTTATTAVTTKSGKRSGEKVRTTKDTRTTTSSTRSTETSTTTARALPKNQQLVERLRKLLTNNPDMNKAATGFRNQGQFVAAVHASANHGLSFTELKKRMVEKNMSLGQAMKDMRRNIDADAGASVAMQQANQDLADASPKRRTR